jgi:hypothetical protein
VTQDDRHRLAGPRNAPARVARRRRYTRATLERAEHADLVSAVCRFLQRAVLSGEAYEAPAGDEMPQGP